MKKQQILVVDDERDLCEILQFNLTSVGYVVDIACSGAEALNKDISRYDLVLLDTPPINIVSDPLALSSKCAGALFVVRQEFSDHREIRRALVSCEMTGLEVLGFVLNRTSVENEAPQPIIMRYDGLRLDVACRTVTVDGELVSLTRTEFDLLYLLLGHPGQVFSRQEVLEHVWPHNVVVTDRTVDVNITRMRKKIGRYSACIITRHGFGYQFIGV